MSLSHSPPDVRDALIGSGSQTFRDVRRGSEKRDEGGGAREEAFWEGALAEAWVGGEG